MAIWIRALFVLSSILSNISIATPIGITDFGSGAVTRTYDNLGLLSTIPTPADLYGDIYTTDPAGLQYGGTCFTVEFGCLATWSDGGYIEVVLAEQASKAGAFVADQASALAWPISAQFYDSEGLLLGTVTNNVNQVGPFGHSNNWVFLGWQTDLNQISKIRFTSPIDGSGMAVDNLTTETMPVPEPATVALFFIGLAGLGWSKRLYKESSVEKK